MPAADVDPALGEEVDGVGQGPRIQPRRRARRGRGRRRRRGPASGRQLEDDRAGVVGVVGKVDGAAGDLHAVIEHGLMHGQAVDTALPEKAGISGQVDVQGRGRGSRRGSPAARGTRRARRVRPHAPRIRSKTSAANASTVRPDRLVTTATGSSPRPRPRLKDRPDLRPARHDLDDLGVERPGLDPVDEVLEGRPAPRDADGQADRRDAGHGVHSEEAAPDGDAKHSPKISGADQSSSGPKYRRGIIRPESGDRLGLQGRSRLTCDAPISKYSETLMSHRGPSLVVFEHLEDQIGRDGEIVVARCRLVVSLASRM